LNTALISFYIYIPYSLPFCLTSFLSKTLSITVTHVYTHILRQCSILVVNFWSVTYFGVFNFGTSYIGAKIGQNKTMTKISRLITIYWYLIHVDWMVWNGNSKKWTLKKTPLKTIGTMLFLVFSVKFSSCFLLFNIAELIQYRKTKFYLGKK
jgi:hypothetical protein